MAIIFNSKAIGITQDEMKKLYRNNLIICNDFSFTMATVPDWAIDEANELIKKEIKGRYWDENILIPENKIAIEKYNKESYPGLYEKTMKV